MDLRELIRLLNERQQINPKGVRVLGVAQVFDMREPTKVPIEEVDV